MIDFRFGRHALGVSVATAMLAGCGGSQPPIASPQLRNSPRAPKQSQTFNYTGSEQTFTVPEGVTRVTIKASGASGQGGYSSYGPGAPGGLIVATVRVTPGESLAVFVAVYPDGTPGGTEIMDGVGGANSSITFQTFSVEDQNDNIYTLPEMLVHIVHVGSDGSFSTSVYQYLPDSPDWE
jgi:hypothetical protein